MILLILLIFSVCILIVEIKSQTKLEEKLTTLLSGHGDQSSLNPKFKAHESSIVSSRCCLSLIISSEAKTVKMYPNVLGTYKIEQRSYYKNTEKNVYLAKPFRSSELTQEASFTWGVNSSPQQTWGWVRAVRDQECPEEVEQWAVYDQVSRGWTRDNTLKIHCVPS